MTHIPCRSAAPRVLSRQQRFRPCQRDALSCVPALSCRCKPQHAQAGGAPVGTNLRPDSAGSGCLQVLSVQTALSIQSHPDKELAARLHKERPNVRCCTEDLQIYEPVVLLKGCNSGVGARAMPDGRKNEMHACVVSIAETGTVTAGELPLTDTHHAGVQGRQPQAGDGSGADGL